jgi:type I restriction enzyme S subunit
LQPDDSFEADYFYYAMKGWEGYLKGQTSGSGIPHVDKEVIGKLDLLAFSKHEQTKIAEVLATVDQAIEQTEVLIAKQQRIKTGLMQDLLTRGIDEHGQLRTEQTHAFKDSPLGRIPVEWDISTLNSLVDESITYGIVQAGPHIEGGIPYVRTGDMSGDWIDKSNLLRTSKAIASAYIRSQVNENDIVFSLRANVGKVLPIHKELAGSNLTQGTAKISPNSKIHSEFLIHAMRGKRVQDQIRLVEKGTTFMEITLTDLRSLNVIFPTAKSEQLVIAKCLDACLKVGEQYTLELRKLKLHKTSLMQDLLTGRKRVTDLLEPVAA